MTLKAEPVPVEHFLTREKILGGTCTQCIASKSNTFYLPGTVLSKETEWISGHVSRQTPPPTEEQFTGVGGETPLNITPIFEVQGIAWATVALIQIWSNYESWY